MKKLKLKKITLAEMPSESMNKINGGGETHPSVILSLISVYTASIILSACDDCASYGCQSNDCRKDSLASYCLCTG